MDSFQTPLLNKFINIRYNGPMLEQYKALISDTKYDVTLLSNTAAFLYHNLPNINWAGFYLLHHDTLYLGPFVGKVACELITVGKGVCGTCVQLSQTMRVENVHQFDGHIACDPDSNSEIVIPLKLHNQLIGVLELPPGMEMRIITLQ